MSRRILISDTDWLQPGHGATASGGSWISGAGLENLSDRRPQVVAAATAADAGSTQFTVDLSAPRAIGLIYFANLITTAAGTIRVRVATDSGFTSVVYDSTVVSVRPQDAGGSISEAEFDALGRTRIFVPPAPVTGRYVKVEVVDTAATPPLRIGCFCICSVIEPSHNFKYDWSITPIDQSDITRVPFGSTYVTLRGIKNRIDFGFVFLPENEAIAQFLRLLRIKGRSGPLIASLFPDNVSPSFSLERTSVYGTLITDGQLTNPFFQLYNVAMQLEQEI